jgi:hypothetical protein
MTIKKLKISLQPFVISMDDELVAELNNIRSREDAERFISKHISVIVHEKPIGSKLATATPIHTRNHNTERVIRIKGDDIRVKHRIG